MSAEAGWETWWGGAASPLGGDSHDNTAMASTTIAPETTRVEGYEWVLIPSIVLLALTIAGALMILGSMAWLEYRGRPATTRTRLVQALVVSDLILGIVGLIGNVIEVMPGQRLIAGTTTCDGLGFVLVAVLWTEHIWTLCLAIGTYLILIHPLHTLTLVLEKHWIWLWALVWISAIVIAIITQVLYGFQPSGGICYYPSSAGLYGELMQFIPRACVFIGITLLYARLYVFLKRPDKIRSPYSNSPTGGASYDSTSYPKKKLHGFLRKLSGGEKGSGTGTPHPAPTSTMPSPDPNEKQVPPSGSALADSTTALPSREYDRTDRPTMQPNDPLFSSTTFRPSSAPVSPATDIPPWERMELPVFQIDGQRYGGPSGFGNGSPGSGGSASAAQQGMFGGWKGLTGKKRPSTANSSGSATPAFGSGAGGSTGANGSSSPATQQPGRMGSISAYEGSTRSRQPSGDTVDGSMSMRVAGSRKMSSNATATTANTTTNLIPPTSRRPSAIPPETSPVIEQESEYYPDTERRGSGSDLREGQEEEEDEEEEEQEMDLLRMLRQDAEPQGSKNEEIELVPESMASYLNRKTALLMLWFPLGYVLLFSISLIRVVYDFAGTPPTVLRAMSRWFVFAQGVLDALIYGLVEWHTKRVVRRRVRKGALSPGGSRGEGQGSALGSALRSINFRRSQPRAGSRDDSISNSNSHTPTMPQMAGAGMGAGRFPSILQELELDSPRKGSWATSEGKEKGSSVSDNRL